VTSSDGLPPDMEPGSVDIVVLVFVMSALHPDEWGQAISNIYKVDLMSFSVENNGSLTAVADAKARWACGIPRLWPTRSHAAAIQGWPSPR
jgi:hypothetical protein